MRLTRLPAALVTAVLLAGGASCATTIEGSGTVASDVVTGGPTPTSSPTTSNAVLTRERTLCTLERAAIAGINVSFNKSKQRSQQVQILKQGAATINGLQARSGLPAEDAILRAGKAVQTQLAKLHAAASAGESPSTKPYNDATGKFQQACNSIP